MKIVSDTLKALCTNDEAKFPVPILAQFSYDVADPYAVSVAFSSSEKGFTEGGTITTWSFSRSLLAEGFSSQYPNVAGSGDVRTAKSDSGVNYWLAVSSPYGAAEFLFGLDDIKTFLQDTYNLLPADYEVSDVILESELAKILGNP